MVVCEAFLMTLGSRVAATDAEWYEAMIALASGEWSDQQFTDWLREHLVADS